MILGVNRRDRGWVRTVMGGQEDDLLRRREIQD